MIIRKYKNEAENPLSPKKTNSWYTYLIFFQMSCTACGFHKLLPMFRWQFLCAPLSPLDVNSWLVTFGFQLYNVIPGYRKPSTESMEPSYELVRTQSKTQEWDSTKVIHADHSRLSHLSPRGHRSPPCPPHLGPVAISKKTCSLVADSHRRL